MAHYTINILRNPRNNIDNLGPYITVVSCVGIKIPFQSALTEWDLSG